jgi:5,10-methylenetetrahydrofolate reductase
MTAKNTEQALKSPPHAERSANGSSLAEARVILEACPPAVADRDKAYAVLQQCFASYNTFHAISIPDIQDEGEFSRRRARVPNAEFAAWLRQLTGKPVSLYKVSVSCTQQELERWLTGIEELGCRDLFLVGPDSSSKEYKAGALSVAEAARIAGAHGLHCGGVIIPTRRSQFVPRPATVDEADRIERKVREFGFTFFTTQIIYESEWMCCLLLDLVRRLRPEEIPRIFLTFSPFVNDRDIHFAKNYLGIYLPDDVERMLRGARSMREGSISFLLRVWERISTFAAEIGFPVERLGVNAEYIDSRNPRNVGAAFELAEEFGRLLKVK